MRPTILAKKPAEPVNEPSPSWIRMRAADEDESKTAPRKFPFLAKYRDHFSCFIFLAGIINVRTQQGARFPGVITGPPPSSAYV